MENTIDIKNEIEKYSKLDFTEEETTDYLLKKGFTRAQIKTEIHSVYPEITKKSIRSSPYFIISFVVITLMALSPFIAYLFQPELTYGLSSALLLISVFGYYKLMRLFIITWIVIISFVILYVLYILLLRMSGGYVNSFLSYGLLTSVLAFCSMLLRSLIDVHVKNNKRKMQLNY